MHKSKNRYFYHIFVSSGDAPVAITLNVVWMEREFDAYKLSRCMCRSNYYRFWESARYLWKNRHFITPPCIRRPRSGGSRRNIATRFGVEKLEWCGCPMVKKFRRYLYSFWHDPRTWQTDGHRMPAYTTLMHSIAWQKSINCANSLIHGSTNIKKLQRVQTSAARIVLPNLSQLPATALLCELQWLPVNSRITFKLACRTYKLLTTGQPAYLHTPLHPYTHSMVD